MALIPKDFDPRTNTIDIPPKQFFSVFATTQLEVWWVWLLERKLMHWYSIYNCWYAVPLAYASLVALVVG